MTERRRTPLSREARRAFACTVTSAVQLSPQMRRITLEAEEFRTFDLLAADEYFGLMIPRGSGLHLPKSPPEHITPRALIALIPEEHRPEVRWYTVRAHRPEEGRIDVDMVLHGGAETSGPGGRWAARAEPGDTVGFCECKGNYAPEPQARRILLIGDETSLPAIGALLESPHPGPGAGRLGPVSTTVHVEVPDDGEIQDIASRVPIRWHIRGGRRPGEALLAGLKADQLAADTDYVWLCAEANAVKEARRYLVNSIGIEKSAILFSGYWRLGEARI